MFVGALELDVLLGDVRSLKEKRSVVRPVLAEIRRKYEVSVAEAGHRTCTAAPCSGCRWSPPTRDTSRMCSTRASGWCRPGPSCRSCPLGSGSSAPRTTSSNCHYS
ncbi:hypothetical protein KUTG_06799 [Kutzneria sp. 744]|nr:hypothetical protein KUTG_06799 [Kutzneria sp. 744]